MSFPEITLRYFNCHGRIQHIRYYFIARDIAFTDDRIELDENWASWQAIKNDTTKTGPFHKLPLLEWGGRKLVEAPVIHDWIHHYSGDAKSLTEDENLQHAMLASSCSSEMMMPTGLLLWVEITHPGVDLKEQVQSTLTRIQDHLLRLEETLNEWNWWNNLSNRKIMLADCVLWQQLWLLQHLFGSVNTLDAVPELNNFYENCSERTLFSQFIDAHKLQLTGRPQEEDVILRINDLV